MIIKPKTRGFICTTAHKVGCEEEVKRQIDYVKSKEGFKKIQNALIIGASTGYGLASRITATFGMGASTVGVMYEKEPTETKTASAGFYNTVAFEKIATKEGYKNYTLNGDAFSDETKQKVFKKLKEEGMKLDLIVYSLASPRRKLKNGDVVSSVLKTIDKPYTQKTINLQNNEVCDITIEEATTKEIEDTVKVMGGEDWYEWIKGLKEEGLINEGAKTIAYSYIGPKLTHPIYKDGTIGRAKDDLYKTSLKISEDFEGIKGYISINKALVTQASAAIPIVPLYISILYKVMKEKKKHEGCIEQIARLFSEKINKGEFDSNGLIRLDDYEMQKDIQDEVLKNFSEISTENLDKYADLKGYKDEFLNLFGFLVSGVDYEKDISPLEKLNNEID